MKEMMAPSNVEKKKSLDQKMHVALGVKDVMSYLTGGLRFSVQAQKDDVSMHAFLKTQKFHTVNDYFSNSKIYSDLTIKDVDDVMPEFNGKYENFLSRVSSEETTKEELLEIIEDLNKYIFSDKFQFSKAA